MKKRVYQVWLAMMLGIILMTIPVCGAVQKQEFQTLELVKVYESEEELREAYPEQFPKSGEITEDEKFIYLPDIQLKREDIESLTKEEQQRLRSVDEDKLPIKNGIMRTRVYKQPFFLEADVSVKMREPGYRHEGDVVTKTLTLYNAQREAVAQLAPEVTSIRMSPDRQHFVAYTYNVYGKISDVLYFYDSNGSLLQTRHIIDEPQVTYSQNGEFVQVYSDMEREFNIFTKSGDIVYLGNRRELIPPIRTARFQVFTSGSGNSMLLASDRSIHLYTTRGEFLWTNAFPRSYVVECWFFRQQEKIILKVSTNRKGEDRYDLQIRSLTTGVLLEEVAGIAEMTGVNHSLIVKKGGQYYEYHIQ